MSWNAQRPKMSISAEAGIMVVMVRIRSWRSDRTASEVGIFVVCEGFVEEDDIGEYGMSAM